MGISDDLDHVARLLREGQTENVLAWFQENRDALEFGIRLFRLEEGRPKHKGEELLTKLRKKEKE